MAKKLIFILIIFFEMFAIAQIPKSEVDADVNVFPKEKVALSVNSNLLLAGEVLHYKAFNLSENGGKSTLSKRLYVSLRNENDSVIFSHKLKVEKGTANGDFFIPSNLKTGIYRLIGYTNFSLNNINNVIAENRIYVLNTFKNNRPVNSSADTVKVFAVSHTKYPQSKDKIENASISIETNKTSYGKREKVTLNMKSLNNAAGNYALSVRRVDPVEVAPYVDKNIPKPERETFYIPEIRGEIISGVVVLKAEKRPIADKEVSLTIPGKDYIFKTARTNADGRFFFSVAGDYDSDKSIVQLAEKELNPASHEIIMDKKEIELGQTAPYFLKISPDLKDWLQERSVQLQVENAYYDIKRDSILPKKINLPFYNNLGTVFNLDDYTRFPSVRETFVEIITLASIRGTGYDTRFIINNEYDPNRTAKFNDIPPLVLLDGIQIIDNTELIDYNVKEIKSVRVIIEPYRYGPKIYSGIIVVETKKGNYFPNEEKDKVSGIELFSTVKPKIYYQPDYGQKSNLSRIPDYRVQLLWKPNVNLSQENFTTSFYTSDVSGVYEISIEGFSDIGKYIFTKKYFKVVEN